MKKLISLILLLAMAAAFVVLPAHAGELHVETATVSFGQVEPTDNALLWGAVYGQAEKMLFLTQAVRDGAEVCITIPVSLCESMVKARLFCLQNTTLIPLRDAAVSTRAVPDDPIPGPNAIAVVKTGERYEEVETLTQMLNAIDQSGNSVVTLYQDITTSATINLPYCCTLDFNGHTVRTNPDKGNGIMIQAVGTENKTTTVKNGRLVHFELGFRVNAGGIVVDNMTVDSYNGAPVGIYDATPGYTNLIKNSRLSSQNYGCVSFNKSNTDFSGVTLTIENTQMVSYKTKNSSTSNVFVRNTNAKPGTVIFGQNVDAYSYSQDLMNKDYPPTAGETPVMQGASAIRVVDGKTYAGLNHWTTSPVQPTVPDLSDFPTTGPDYLVGYGRKNITPAKSVPLAGYSDTSNRMSTGVYTDLFVSAVAVTDRMGETALLLSVDLINPRATTGPIRTGIWEAIGVDPDKIMVTYSHTHSGPDLNNNTATDYMAEYRALVISQAVAAAVEAWNDRKEAEMYTGTISTSGLNFVRNYRMKDGSYSSSGSITSSAVEHIGTLDEELRLIRFDRGEAKPVLLMNWQAHAVLASHCQPDKNLFYKVNADYIAGLRKYVEEELGCKFSYFQGGAGNINPVSRIVGETPTHDIYEYGRLLGAYVRECLEKNMKKAEAGPILAHTFIFRYEGNHWEDHLLPQALEVQKVKEDTGSESKANAKAKALGLRNYTHATYIITNSKRPEYYTERCTVLSVGGVGFAAMPHELFCEAGVQIRADSPFDMTFILAYSNDGNGYLPIREAYVYAGYESGISHFNPGAAEAMEQQFAESWAYIHP